MTKKLVGVYVQVGENPKVLSTDGSLEVLQAMVGGRIEVSPLASEIIMIVNEEGLFQNLDINFTTHLEGEEDMIIPSHLIHGHAFIVSTLGEDFFSLDKEQIQKVLKAFSNNRYSVNLGDFK